VKRWALLLPVFLLGLFTAFHATAATNTTKDTMVLTGLVPVAGGQFKLTVTQQSPDTAINSFVFVPGSGLTVSRVVSLSRTDSSCTISGRNISCNAPLELAPCTCQPGGTIDIYFEATGDPAASMLQVNGLTFAVTLYAGTTTTTATTTSTTTTTTAVTTTRQTTTTSKPPVKHKKIPKCKKGQKSTKKHRCHK
jgi:hypothetical protein